MRMEDGNEILQYDAVERVLSWLGWSLGRFLWLAILCPARALKCAFAGLAILCSSFDQSLPVGGFDRPPSGENNNKTGCCAKVSIARELSARSNSKENSSFGTIGPIRTSGDVASVGALNPTPANFQQQNHFKSDEALRSRSGSQ